MFETNNTLRAEVLAVKRYDAIHLHKNPPRDQTTEAPVASTASSGGLSLKGAEDALTKFVDEGWLLESKYLPPPWSCSHRNRRLTERVWAGRTGTPLPHAR
jgi:hypothetical protein